MGQQIRAADCTNCNQGRGAECRCGDALRITAHLPRLTAEPRTQVRAAVEMRF